MIIAQFYPIIWVFLWPAILVVVCHSLFPVSWMEDETKEQAITGIPLMIGYFVFAKIYNNIFYYVKIPCGKVYCENDTAQFYDEKLEILTPMKMCLLDTFKILGKRVRGLYSKKNCMWINLYQTRDEKRIQYYPGTQEFNMRELNGAYALFCMEGIPFCKYYIVRDNKGLFYITDAKHYPEDEEKFTLVASMLSKNIYTYSQLSELHRIRGEASYIADFFD
jgi:hypothetical protein